MTFDAIAALLWSMLGASLILSLWGCLTRSARLMWIAGALSVVFGVAAIFSIGIFVLMVAATQAAVAVVLQRAGARG